MQGRQVENNSIVEAQRAVLETLTTCNTQQERALNTGNLELLAEMSQLRARAVAEAKESIPPIVAWSPVLADLVKHVAGESAAVEIQVQACLLRIQHEMAELTKREKVVNYLAHSAPKKRANWKA